MRYKHPPTRDFRALIQIDLGSEVLGQIATLPFQGINNHDPHNHLKIHMFCLTQICLNMLKRHKIIHEHHQSQSIHD